ncbi:Zinc finger protein [Plakobranchus ocellatus]|uniref:Zinc finger protein n=1 Tax=Plakobranchus ocellatus TaxID=259542 RepID=A0AAV4C064_9GAST|nr:Zinc finger protein [Plakobranchus ocellatus]
MGYCHMKTLSELFKRLQEANFTVRPVKCLLGSRTVDFLGNGLGRGAIGLQDENVEKVRNAPRPKTKREVRAFLGLVGYYKEFVPNFAAVSAPLSDLVRKGQPNIVNWGDSQERAYNSLKVAVTSKPVLQLPDVNKRFVLRTNASNRGLGAALMQENEGTLFPVAYASKELTDREKKYSVTEREALAIVWGVKKFSLYLYGTVFTLQTDHGALQFLNARKFDSPRIMRWALALQEIIVEDDVFVLGRDGMVLRMNSSEYKAYVENEGWSDEASEASDEDDGVLDLVAEAVSRRTSTLRWWLQLERFGGVRLCWFGAVY